MKYYLYILKSKSADKYYTGISSDPRRRLHFHNSIEKGFSSRYRPWELVFVKRFPDKATAAKVEKKMKSWKSKKMIMRVIEGDIEI